MEILKQGSVTESGVPDAQQLEKINRLSRAELKADDVYVFAVRLCDDRPDRDFERFSAQALRELAPMFVGRTGIVDHNWSAEKQLARIFECDCEVEQGVTFLRAWAYMLRAEKTKDVIAAIDGGILKEVSVGCAIASAICSVCGAPYGTCEHRKGERYGTETCVAVLSEAVDAYEFSFVAVPAQRAAGVIKGFSDGPGDAELKALRADASLGREYLETLRAEFVRLALVLGFGLDGTQLKALAGRMTADELKSAGRALAEKEAELFPVQVQLKAFGAQEAAFGSEYMI